MATSPVKFTGTNSFSGALASTAAVYLRSSDATDDDPIYIAGTDGSADAAGETLTPATSAGKVEILSAGTYASLLYGAMTTAAVGNVRIYANDGTAAVGYFIVTDAGGIGDGDQISIGPVGFAKTATFRTTPSTDNEIKINLASAAATADRIASWINDASTGSSVPVDGTDWIGTGTAPANANSYITATVSGSIVTITDRIKCARSLGWTMTTDDEDSVGITAPAGGADGTLLGMIAAGTSTISTSAGSGINLSNADLTVTTLPPGLTGSSASVRVGGKVTLHIWLGTDPAAAITSIVQRSVDNVNWLTCASMSVTDLDTDQNQVITSTELCEYVRWQISANSSTIPVEANVHFIY